MRAFQPLACIALGIGLLASTSASAQAQATPKPDIENFAGVFFFCKPLADEAWSARSCQEAGAKMAALAARAKKPIVVLKIGDTREKHAELAKAQGFDSNRALWFLLSIDRHAQNKGQWEIVARADGMNATTSASGGPQTVTYSRRATVVSASAVAEKGVELLEGIMAVLTTPMRPL